MFTVAIGIIFSYSSDMSVQILIADDEGINRLFVKTILVAHGWTVEDVSNGRDAVDIFENTPFDIVILDVKMPVMGGKHAASEIRSIEEKQGREPAVLLGLTAYAEKELVDELMQHGMNGVIHKPITEGALIRKINSMLESRDPE